MAVKMEREKDESDAAVINHDSSVASTKGIIMLPCSREVLFLTGASNKLSN